MGTIELPKPGVAEAKANRRFAWITQELSTHVREYGGTFATEFTVLASQLLVYKLAALFLGKSGFAEYAVARRTISLIYPIPLLGMAVALPRYIAHVVGAGSGGRPAKYFGAAVWCVGAGLLVSVLLMNLFPGMFAYVFFAGGEYANLVFPLSLLLVGLVLHALVYSYFRGCLEMRRANLLQLINYGIVPLAAFVTFHNSVESVLLALGILTVLVASVGLALAPLPATIVRVAPEAKELLRYGVQRVPGDFVQMALFTFPVTFLAHSRGVKEAGVLAFGISFLSMAGSVFTPVGLVLLPKASKMLAEGAFRELRAHILRIATITLVVSAALTVLFEVMAGSLVQVYFGAGFEDVASIIRVMAVGIVPFALYFVLRSLVDAYHMKAINVLNNGIAFLTFVSCAGALFIFRGTARIPVAFLAGVFVLGVLTTLEARKILANQES